MGSSATNAPLRIGRVTLAVRDAERVAAFYREVVGLADLGTDGGVRRLGVGSRTLLELVPRPEAPPADPRSAGLFHTAFLLPTRRDLARWLRHAVASNIPLQGASDHGVSEAIYLADPEGNGIEIYRDREPESWTWADGEVLMPTHRLDAANLLAEAQEEPFAGAPDGTLVGHIHLQTGSVDVSEAFYREVLGFERMHRRAAASFLSTGGYHHHVAVNTWNSAGAGPRPDGGLGLVSFELLARDGAAFAQAEARILASGETASRTAHGAILATDPYRIGIVLRDGGS